MTEALENPLQLAPTYDEEALRLLSVAQNGVAAIQREEDETGQLTGFLSLYPIDVSQYVPPTLSRAAEALLDYASAKQNEILARAWTFNVAADGSPAHVVSTKLDASGQLAMMKLALWLTLNAGTAATARMPYNNVNSTSDSLTYAEVQSLVAQTGDLNIKSYSVLNPVCDQIRAGTMKTQAEVDAALAAIAS